MLQKLKQTVWFLSFAVAFVALAHGAAHAATVSFTKGSIVKIMRQDGSWRYNKKGEVLDAVFLNGKKLIIEKGGVALDGALPAGVSVDLVMAGWTGTIAQGFEGALGVDAAGSASVSVARGKAELAKGSQTVVVGKDSQVRMTGETVLCEKGTVRVVVGGVATKLAQGETAVGGQKVAVEAKPAKKEKIKKKKEAKPKKQQVLDPDDAGIDEGDVSAFDEEPADPPELGDVQEEEDACPTAP